MVQKIDALNWTTDSENQDNYNVINNVQDNLQLKWQLFINMGCISSSAVKEPPEVNSPQQIQINSKSIFFFFPFNFNGFILNENFISYIQISIFSENPLEFF